MKMPDTCVSGIKVQGSKDPESLYLRETLFAPAPPARTVDRASVDAPAVVAGVPAGVHSAEVSILTTEVEDEPLGALAVGRKERFELGDGRFRLVSQLSEDGSVGRVLLELPDDEFGFFGRRDFQTQELGLEVVPHHDDTCLLEVFLGGGDSRLGRDANGAEKGEERNRGDFLQPQLELIEKFVSALSTKLLEKFCERSL